MMDEKYPVMKIVREKLKELDKTLAWLSLQTGRTTRWYAGEIEIERIEYEVLRKMSKALHFDFVSDHRRFLGENPLPGANVRETEPFYERQEKKITVQMTLMATITNFQTHYPKMLQKMQEEGEKLGFKIT